MLKLVRTHASASSEHEDQFLRRDQWLRSWAMKLCQGDAESADDLLQNAFIQFCLRRVDLESISDIDAYLYTMLRNLRLSQLRLATRAERRTIPIEEYEWAIFGGETETKGAFEFDLVPPVDCRIETSVSVGEDVADIEELKEVHVSPGQTVAVTIEALMLTEPVM